EVIAGAATVALEIFEDRPQVDALVIPIGGGGLASGMALVAKRVSAECETIGVEAAASCAFHTSVAAGRLVEIVPRATLADGLGGNPDPDTITSALIQRHVDRIVTVTEDDLADAIRGLVRHEHLVSEGAGAAAVAAVAVRRANVEGRTIVVVVSGANIDSTTLTRVLERS